MAVASDTCSVSELQPSSLSRPEARGRAPARTVTRERRARGGRASVGGAAAAPAGAVWLVQPPSRVRTHRRRPHRRRRAAQPSAGTYAPRRWGQRGGRTRSRRARPLVTRHRGHSAPTWRRRPRERRARAASGERRAGARRASARRVWLDVAIVRCLSPLRQLP